MASPDGSVFRWAAIGFSPIRYIGSTVFAETGARRKGSESRGPFATGVGARGDVLVNSRRGSKAVMRRPAKPLRSVRLRLAPPGLFRCGHSPRIASRAVRLRAAVERDVDVCRRVSTRAARRLLFAMHFPIDRLSGLGRSGARARTSRAARSRRHSVDIHPYPGVIERVLPNALRAAVSRGRARRRCRRIAPSCAAARANDRARFRGRGATGGAATSRRAGFGRASRAQAGVTSARSK